MRQRFEHTADGGLSRSHLFGQVVASSDFPIPYPPRPAGGVVVLFPARAGMITEAKRVTLAAIMAEGGKVDEETFVATDDCGPEDGPIETHAEITARARAAKTRAAARRQS
jgi:hypothetical protein